MVTRRDLIAFTAGGLATLAAGYLWMQWMILVMRLDHIESFLVRQ